MARKASETTLANLAKGRAKAHDAFKNRKTPNNSDPDRPLSERQRIFIHNLVHNKLTQTVAARQAGFSHPGAAAYEQMRNPKVLAAIAEEREAYARASAMTKKKVVDGFVEAIEMGRIKGDPLAMIAGWREVAKMCGFYEPTKAQLTVSVQGQVMLHRLNALPDEELLRLAEGNSDSIEGEFSVVDE